MNPTLTTLNTHTNTTGESAGDGVGEPAGQEPAKPDDPDPAEGHGLVVALERNTQDCSSPADPWLRDQFMRIAELAGITAGQITLVMVDDAQMTDLHMQYRHEPGTTDVLTFDLRDDTDQPAGAEVQADIVLCMDEAKRQAEQRGHETRLELLLYAVHGLLHLLGEDDHEPQAYERMHQREDDLLTRAGFGPLFGDRST